MRNFWKALFVLAFVSALAATPRAGNAVLVTAGNPLTFNYDFTGDPLAGPFPLASFTLVFSAFDPLSVGEFVTVSNFDSLDNPLGENTITPSGGGVFDNIGFTGGGIIYASPITDPAGSLVVSTVGTGSFDLTRITFLLRDDITNQIGTERLEIDLPTAAPSPVPLPATLPLLAGGLGLIGLIGWRRRRSA